MDASAPSWPGSASEWRDAIASGLELEPSALEARLMDDDLAYVRVVEWLETEYSAERGYHPDFVPALTRNVRGFLAWACNRGPEPHWPGSDPS